MSRVLPVINRSCGECRKCCEGWLSGDIYGKPMFKGQACHYLGGDGCTIYEQRPEDPCKSYTCSWLDSDIFPMWLKPSMTDVIISRRRVAADVNILYYAIMEAGSKIDSVVLNWLIQWAMSSGNNMHYEVSGKSYMIGTKEFVSKMLESASGKAG